MDFFTSGKNLLQDCSISKSDLPCSSNKHSCEQLIWELPWKKCNLPPLHCNLVAFFKICFTFCWGPPQYHLPLLTPNNIKSRQVTLRLQTCLKSHLPILDSFKATHSYFAFLLLLLTSSPQALLVVVCCMNNPLPRNSFTIDHFPLLISQITAIDIRKGKITNKN